MLLSASDTFPEFFQSFALRNNGVVDGSAIIQLSGKTAFSLGYRAVLEFVHTQRTYLGIINGMGDGTFGPARSATRAQAAAMLARFYRAVME